MALQDFEAVSEVSDMPKRLDLFRAKIERGLATARELVRRRLLGLNIVDFDIRGELYALALELSPDARNQEAGTLMEWMDLKGYEHCVDIASRTGLLTKRIVQQTTGNVYAIDPSTEQLRILKRDLPSVHTIHGSPDHRASMATIPRGSVDVFTSQGGIHHVADQRAMFENMVEILTANGRCVCADVCADTPLAHHFDAYVSHKCLTGHEAQWLSEARLQELIADLPFDLIRAERIPVSWEFHSRAEMALFFKGLHAYDLSEEEVLADLETALGITEKDGIWKVGWPLLFFEIQKRTTT